MSQSTEFAAAWAAVQKITDPAEILVLSRAAHTLSQNKARLTMTYGQKVKFFARNTWIEGVIDGINSKSVSVRTSQGKWRVAPTNLQAA